MAAALQPPASQPSTAGGGSNVAPDSYPLAGNRGGRLGLIGVARRWWPLWLGLAAMYLPTLSDLMTGLWSTPEQGHGPIVLAVALWLLYRNWPVAGNQGPTAAARRWGWAGFVMSLALYVLGRSQDILLFEVGSAVLMTVSLLLLMFGSKTLRSVWFTPFFMLFMIPLPGALVDALTMPLKISVSYVVAEGLFAAGYPIAREGVILQVGQYQLMVADVCAGLQTLFTLEAMGLLYLNLVRHDSLVRNVALAILIVPISFVANVIRVGTLTLITYYFGDAAGQGFLHGFAGMVLFMSALLLVIAVDSMLRLGVRDESALSAT